MKEEYLVTITEKNENSEYNSMDANLKKAKLTKKAMGEKILKSMLNYDQIEKLEFNDGHCFGDYYDYTAVLGSGAFGLVISAVELTTGEMCAIKVTNFIILFPYSCFYLLIKLQVIY
jgi:hypothetical protein